MSYLYLYVSDVAAYLGVRPRTVHSYLYESREGGRYEAHPFPAPDGWAGIPAHRQDADKRGGRPFWRAERKEEFAAWWEQRPRSSYRRGRGH